MKMKEWLGPQLKSVVNSKSGIKVRRWLGMAPATVSNQEIDHVPVAGDVVVYFSDVLNKTYQLEQWLPTLEKLHEHHRVILVFRKIPTLRHFRKLTDLPKIFVRRFDDLVSLYDYNDFKLCLYVNNGVANFQSLSAARLVHVHVNHGESDKLSMVSNQAKAYDKVFVAGPAAIERHRKVLIDFDSTQLLSVGRPQLDQNFASVVEPFMGRTIMYAPTWEGENEANNYTSLDLFGVKIIRMLVALDNTRIIYKPHPRVWTSTNPSITEAHASIIELLNPMNHKGMNHVIAEGQNILDLFEDVDVLITDISSVGLDFLYLHVDRPLILTDRRNDMLSLNTEAPISKACPVINVDNQATMFNDFEGVLLRTSSEQREQMRTFYFGERLKGESTRDFLAAVDALISERELQLSSIDFHSNASDSGDEE